MQKIERPDCAFLVPEESAKMLADVLETQADQLTSATKKLLEEKG